MKRKKRKEPTATARLLGAELKKLHIEFQYEWKMFRKHVDIKIYKVPILVEVDGPPHRRDRQKGKDFIRDIYSKICGYQTFRFSNDEVNANPAHVASYIQAEIDRLQY